jgi:hypothetical protein
MEKEQIILEIRSVQRDKFHRLGHIRVDGPVNINAGETGVEVETGDTGDGPRHGSTGRR